MSRASSPSSGHRYGTARVCQLWEVPRSTVYARRARASRPAQPMAKRGPNGAGTDAALTEQIRAVLARSPFIGEGCRKAWARLRLAGVRTSKGRVLRQPPLGRHRLLAAAGTPRASCPSFASSRSLTSEGWLLASRVMFGCSGSAAIARSDHLRAELASSR